MAYVVVAVGALMAAAGLYTLAYSVLNTRFEEYWAALEVGATLIAGGMVTIALGLAVRALGQLKTAFATAPLATPETAAAIAAVEPLPALAEPVPAPIALDPLPAVAETPAPAPTERAPHPLRPTIPALAAGQPATETAGSTAVPESLAPTSDDAPASYPATAPQGDDPIMVGFDPHVGAAARPADDYKLETPSTSEHDLPERGADDAGAVTPPPSLPTSEMPDDWLDRAFAELDEELPVDRASTDPSPPEPPREPAMAEPKVQVAAPAPLPSSPPAPDAPISQVIGRYEADGTSYVMYADGSIEAQSSNGVYRFASMAELKSFIET